MTPGALPDAGPEQVAPSMAAFEEGDRSTDCFRIIEDRVRIRLRKRTLTTPTGRDVVVDLGPAEVFGETT